VITKAVVLAAGRGTRLGALTERTPKALIEVAGVPLIGHVLGGLQRAGIEDVTVVTGYLGQAIEAEIGTGAQSGMRITYVRQEKLEGTAAAVALARDHAEGEAFFVGWGDILVRPENYRRVISAARFANGSLAVNDTDDPWAGAAVHVDEAMHVTRIIEKPPKGTSTTRWNNAGLCVLPPAIWEEIDRLKASVRGEYELPEAVAALVAAGAVMRAVPIEGPWFDIGAPDDLDRARREWEGRPD